jgi:hypothetical protein
MALGLFCVCDSQIKLKENRRATKEEPRDNKGDVCSFSSDVRIALKEKDAYTFGVQVCKHTGKDIALIIFIES